MTAPDVVYFCRAGSNDELRFSLRSLENVPHGEVWVFGARPRWYRGRFVRIPQVGKKHENVRQAMRRAAAHPDVSEQFILMNDDFYIVKPVAKVPQMNLGPIDAVVDRYTAQVGRSRYVVGMERTARKLRERGVEVPLSYEVHAPMLATKTALGEALQIGGNPRSIMGNLHGPKGRTVADVKVYKVDQALPAGPFISSEDNTFRYVLRPMLGELFPERSAWEAK